MNKELGIMNNNEEEKEESSETSRKIPTLRTFKTDASEYIKNKKVSMVDIVMSGAGVKKRKLENINKTEFFKKILLILLFLIILGGGVGAYFLFFKNKEEVSPVVLLPKSIIIADDESPLNINDIENIFTISSQPREFLYIPVTRNINNTQQLITPKDFFNELKINSPSGFLDSINDKFMITLYYTNQNWPALIFKIRSYENTFSYIYNWEENIFYDLGKVLRVGNLEIGDNIFYDKEIQNHDTRVLNSIDGKPVLYYSLFNKKYLIITTGEDALREVFRRLSSSQYLNE